MRLVTGKFIDLNATLSIIALNINGLNTPIKDRDCQIAY